MKIIIFLLFVSTLCGYDRNLAIQYAQQWWNSANHDCNTDFSSCSPFSYWGSEICSYGSHGGDCANFVSQCLLAGGHAALNQGACRGYPCGVEEIGAWELGNCLPQNYGWKKTCGYRQPPPADIQPGDVLVYFSDGCESGDGHATIVVEGGSNAKIACHSSMQYGADYNYQAGSKDYYEWLQYTG